MQGQPSLDVADVAYSVAVDEVGVIARRRLMRFAVRICSYRAASRGMRFCYRGGAAMSTGGKYKRYINGDNSRMLAQQRCDTH